MQRVIVQKILNTLAMRSICTLAIGLLLVVMPAYESLASTHRPDIVEHDHKSFSDTGQAHSSVPCHDFRIASSSGQYNHVSSLSFEPEEVSADASLVASRVPTKSFPIRYSRDESWRSEPSIHLVNCVFLN
jgi:hypothetical protein